MQRLLIPLLIHRTIGAVPFPFTEVVFGTDLTLINPNNVALPITLISFKAWPDGRLIKLDWEVETDEDGFYTAVLERSENGIDFKEISKRTVFGFSRSSYNDVDVATGVNYYYRLKLSEPDGNYKYSDIRSASIDGQGLFYFSLSPNQTHGDLTVYVETPESQDIRFEVIDLSGRMIHGVTLLTENRLIEKSIDFSELHAGVYQIRVIAGNSSITKKVIFLR